MHRTSDKEQDASNKRPRTFNNMHGTRSINNMHRTNKKGMDNDIQNEKRQLK